MKKRVVVFTVVALVVSLFIFTFFNNMGVIDISKYEQKYQYAFNNIEDCVTHSNMAVIAEYVGVDTFDQCRFTVKEWLYSENDLDNKELHVRIREKPDYSISKIGSIGKRDPSTDYRCTNWYRSILLVDLIPGEEYLIIGECNGTYTYGEYKGVERCEQYVILYPDYPFTEEAFIENKVENPENYVSVTEYAKYIDKRYGHGSKEW
ncbi:MAG: hypothetical protein E7564_05315 [Ruminococcaceae bacterium]|nr:hypothetical protein [Oscillospiraceae bacterium]